MRSHVMRFARPAIAAAALAAAVADAGCASKDKPDAADPVPQALQTQGEANRAMLNMAFTRQARNGIAEERAVYPYHFAPGSARLNELGERQVEVIAHEYGDAADVRVALVRGDADDALFDARTDAVRQGLAAAGMAGERVAVAESQPGGRGLSSAQVQLMLAEEQDLGAAAGGSATGVRTGTSGGR